MGVFSKNFGSASDIDEQLEDIYLPMIQQLTGNSSEKAKHIFDDLLKMAKMESQKQGSSKLPNNFGDLILEKESTDEKIKSMLAKRRKEGVKDEDIRWWWNMNDTERRMMMQYNNWMILSLFIKLREEDQLTKEEATRKVQKIHPTYNDPENISVDAGDDNPLPYELKPGWPV